MKTIFFLGFRMPLIFSLFQTILTINFFIIKKNVKLVLILEEVISQKVWEIFVLFNTLSIKDDSYPFQISYFEMIPNRVDNPIRISRKLRDFSKRFIIFRN